MRKFLQNFIVFFTSLNKNIKSLILVSCDSFILFFSWCLFFPLPAIIITNFEFNLTYYFLQIYTVSFVLSLSVYLIVMHLLGGFREVIRSFTIENILPITFATSAFIFIMILSNSLLGEKTQAAYIIFIQAISAGTISFTFITFTRLFFRIIASFQKRSKNQKILIFGVGKSANELYASLTLNSQKTIIGFISHDYNSVGREIFGKKILSIKQAKDILESGKTIQLYLASRSVGEQEQQELINFCSTNGIKVKKISSYSDMLKENEISLKDLNISDLIPRTNIDKFSSEMKVLEDQVIIVTGAGGSIGSELSLMMSKKAKLKKLILIDISEAALFSISEEIKSINPSLNIISLILDIKDKSKVKKIIDKFKPHTIYHAAAYKHVPILETEDNFIQAIENNFLGTASLAMSCLDADVKNFVFISTDKAVRPTNIMGASKRMAELYIESLNKVNPKMNYLSVRFGNVIDSSGSVIPTFRKQIKNGGPVTVTHPDIIRYFMTIGEAAYLVIISSIISDSSGVYMLKMGEPVKILDIAKKMINLSGNTIKTDDEDGIEIIFTGLRPGEKLYEELLVDESNLETKHPKIFKDTSDQDINLDELDELILIMKEELNKDKISLIKEKLKKYADYRPS